MIICKKCKFEIREDEAIHIYGTAIVDGVTTIKKFKDAGIEWDVGDSSDEYVLCPNCRHPVNIRED